MTLYADRQNEQKRETAAPDAIKWDLFIFKNLAYKALFFTSLILPRVSSSGHSHGSLNGLFGLVFNVHTSIQENKPVPAVKIVSEIVINYIINENEKTNTGSISQ